MRGLQRPLITLIVAPLVVAKHALVASGWTPFRTPTRHLDDTSTPRIMIRKHFGRVRQALDGLPGLSPARPGRVVATVISCGKRLGRVSASRGASSRIGRGWRAPEKSFGCWMIFRTFVTLCCSSK